MKTKTSVLSTIIAAITITSVMGFTNNQVFAENEDTQYKMAEDVRAILTFTFRDGVEVHEFPVFSMTSDYVDNKGPTFEVKGVVGDAPHLHKALDEAFKYRLMKASVASNIEYDYRYFDVQVDITKDSEILRTLGYYNCEIQDYRIDTLESKDYESYLSSKSGFAIVDDIEFQCSGLNSGKHNLYDSDSSIVNTVYDYGESQYEYAENVRTFVTFKFDNGMEKIEFPTFKIMSGFDEENDSGPSFFVEGIVNSYPLLHDAIDKARKVSGIHSGYNKDFDATIEFVNGEKTLRGIDYADCRVTAAKIKTLYDKEEGFTGKRGFALVDQIDITCAGMTPLNPNYDSMYNGIPIMQTTLMTNEHLDNGYNMGTGPHAIATFTFDNSVETINFPLFDQGAILTRSNPTFSLEGIVGDYPLLYKRVDDATKIGAKSTGANSISELFDVDVNLVYGDDVSRGIGYVNCRVTDYVIETQSNKEENYFKGFAISNKFDFECQGYHPYNPPYDTLFVNTYKRSSISSLDLRDTQDWTEVYKYHN